MQFKKLILLSAFCLSLMICKMGAFAQSYPSYYQLNTNHPAYTTGASFGGSPEFIKGFCFAWDALSPIAQGYSGPVLVRRSISSDLTGLPYDVVFYQVVVTLPDTGIFHEYALGVQSYGDYLAGFGEYDAKDFWYGYALLLDMAGYNPNILIMQPGQSM